MTFIPTDAFLVILWYHEQVYQIDLNKKTLTVPILGIPGLL